MLARLVEHFVSAVGPEKALEDAQARLEDAQAKLAVHDRSSPTESHSLPWWFKHARELVSEVAEARGRVETLQSIKSGKKPALWVLDLAARDRDVIHMAISEGAPDPRVLTRALAGLAPRMGDAERLRQIDRATTHLAGAYRDGTENVTQASYDLHLRKELPELDALVQARDRSAAAVSSIRGFLIAHAPAALNPVSAVADGIHDVQAIRNRQALASDAELTRLDRELSDVQSRIDALGFGGRVLGSEKANQLATVKASIVAQVETRKTELVNALGQDAETLASKAAAGDPAALEQVALVVKDEPSAFPSGLLDRVLDVQVEALCQAPTVAVDALVV